MATKELIDMKRKLLHAFLNTPLKDQTNEEVDIMWALSKDKDIQQILENAKNKGGDTDGH